MNIVFWSPLCGHGATTSNLTCMAIMSSLMYNLRTVSFQSAFSNNYLDQTFIGSKKNNAMVVSEELVTYAQKGIDGVMSSMEMNTFVKEDIKDYVVEVVKNLNYYIPSTKRSNEEVFKKRLSKSLPQILKACNDCFDLTFIDHQGGDENVSRQIFSAADLCVINLSQNPELINFAREKIKELNCQCEIMYIIGRYDESNKYTLKAITREFKISKKDIGVILYNSEFMDAVLSGQTKEFLRANMNCQRRNYNYEFMQEAKDLTYKLLAKAGVLHA